MILYTKPSTIQRTRSHFTEKKHSGAARVFLAALLAFQALITFSCAKQQSPVIIWTDQEEFASYTELFNASHSVKAVVVYKKEAFRSLPPARDEQPPDIVIASWLKNSSTRKYFSSLDYMFGEQKIRKEAFYDELLKYGEINGGQYLLPVNFNLPAMVLSKGNDSVLDDDHIISIGVLKTKSAEFNRQTKNGAFTAMGYAPSWDADFAYQLSKLQGTDYREQDSTFSWNEDSLKLTVNYLRDWTTSCNTDTETEQNFQFKYLFIPKYQQVSSGHCLFAYMSSKEFFSLGEEVSANLSFRWLSDGRKIMVDDDIVMLGLYRRTKESQKAEQFIEWLFREESQRQMLERARDMKLDTVQFGIAGGFSSVKNVNNTIFPSFYRTLLGNLPADEFLCMDGMLPARWLTYKERIVLPYLEESLNTSEKVHPQSLQERLDAWSRQVF